MFQDLRRTRPDTALARAPMKHLATAAGPAPLNQPPKLSTRSRLPTLWSRSFFVASVGAVSAATVQRYIDTQYERPWRKERDR